MADNNAPSIRVLGFRKTYENLPVKGDPAKEDCDRLGYKLDAKGNRVKALQEEVWVTFAPSHSPTNTTTTERVRVLMPDPARMGEDTDGEKLRFMTARWAQIEPAYEAYIKGQEIPLNGTPLAAWPGVIPEQIEVFKQFGIRTVEDVRDLSEGQIDRVRLPNMRELRKQAALFLENSDAAKAAEREAQKDAMLEEMAQKIADLETLLNDKTAPAKVKEKAAA